MTVEIRIGDSRELIKAMPDQSVHCVVTSPPYFGLRDYGVDGQMGLEETPDDFVAGMVDLFRDVRRVLRDDGTLWLNLGDTYSSRPNGTVGKSQLGGGIGTHEEYRRAHSLRKSTLAPGAKHKDLIGIPWRVAFALQADGWYLRQDIVWHKTNPMPESVQDRCTKAHEYIFLMSKSPRYFYDAEAIKEPASELTHARVAKGGDKWGGSQFHTGKTAEHQLGRSSSNRKVAKQGEGIKGNESFYAATQGHVEERNKRSVWSVPTAPFKEAHFATFPPALIEPCILAGCPVGGTVLDPFGGAGTTGLVADRHGRDAILFELNPAYADIARNRIREDAGMFGEIA